jgi:hypothetical protein
MKLNLGLDFNFKQLIVSLIMLLMVTFGIWKKCAVERFEVVQYETEQRNWINGRVNKV